MGEFQTTPPSTKISLPTSSWKCPFLSFGVDLGLGDEPDRGEKSGAEVERGVGDGGAEEDKVAEGEKEWVIDGEKEWVIDGEEVARWKMLPSE